jgi:hypothetical protein
MLLNIRVIESVDQNVGHRFRQEILLISGCYRFSWVAPRDSCFRVDLNKNPVS